MKKLSGIYKFVSPMLLITTIVLIIQIYSLPKKISDAMNIQAQDTVEIQVVKSDKLDKKSDLIYFSGQINKKQVKINESFNFNPNYPTEYWDGWLTLCTSNKGGEYFIWSKEKIETSNVDIDGWFVTVGGKFQHDGDEYLPALIPIVKRE